jgi:hypothetical protein
MAGGWGVSFRAARWSAGRGRDREGVGVTDEEVWVRSEIPDDLRQRIATCADLALLDKWLPRAATAQSSADVGEEDAKTAT